VTFAQGGSETIIATSYYTDQQNNQAVCSIIDVTVEVQSPNADFSFLDDCSNIPIAFSDQSIAFDTNTVINWSWDFGDGSISGQQNPVHIFPDSGSYAVNLEIISSDGCSATSEQNVELMEVPDADFLFTEVCLGYTTGLGYTTMSKAEESSHPRAVVTTREAV